tara:strand:+ start:3138 stop:3755 length:618 start_codon:yes stop_codon:yes gene_type:complete
VPIVKTKKTKHYTYSLWKITEELEELMLQLQADKKELIEINRINNVHRKKQNIAARLILNHLANKKINLSYLQNGSPYCNQFQHISISHSKNYAVLVVSENYVGIDIQHKKPNIEQLKTKFINPMEEKYLNDEETNNTLHFIWCAKEAIYKTLNASCSFRDNIIIDNFFREKTSSGYYQNNNKKKRYNLYYEIFNNYFLVLAKIK